MNLRVREMIALQIFSAILFLVRSQEFTGGSLLQSD